MTKTNLEIKEEFEKWSKENGKTYTPLGDDRVGGCSGEVAKWWLSKLQQRMDEIGSRVGILRQLLNEDHIDDPKKMIDNEYITGVLNIIKSVDKNK